MAVRDWTKTVVTNNDLDDLLAAHQSLLSGDAIVTVVTALPIALRESIQGQFLQAVAFQHLQHKQPEHNRDWNGAWRLFEEVRQHGHNSASPLLLWYAENYCFLTRRNLGHGSDVLTTTYRSLRNTAEMLDTPLRWQLLGFCEYNWARLLLKEKNVPEAAAYYILAGAARVRYYLAVKDCGDEAVVKSAATQVWKIRHDWEKGLLPVSAMELCPVTAELYAELAPLADPTFSAVKK